MDRDGKKVEMFQAGPCQDAYQLGFLIGKRFSNNTFQSQSLLQTLFNSNQRKFPRYWDELLVLQQAAQCLFFIFYLSTSGRRFLRSFQKEQRVPVQITLDDCSDVLVVGESMAIAAHNEDANVALVGHTYLIKRILSDGMFFVGYTYAGELPSCAFGFNTHGLVFTLDSVPSAEDEIVTGGIGRNFISGGILEATCIEDAISRIRSSKISVGHCYNLIETSTRRILNVETASRKRDSVFEVGEPPFFLANMYFHLQINQVHDENSINRQKRAAALPKKSKEDFLSLLGDTDDRKYPIYMTGPLLHTLCTAVIDMDEQTLSIIEGNPKKGDVSHVFSIKRCHGDHPNAI